MEIPPSTKILLHQFVIQKINPTVVLFIAVGITSNVSHDIKDTGITKEITSYATRTTFME